MPSVRVSCEPTSIDFCLTRGADVPDGFWLQLASRFAPDVRDPAQIVWARLDSLLARRAWLRQACIRWQVSLEWQDTARSIVEDHVRLAGNFRRLISDAPDDSAGLDVTTMLSNTRFSGQLRPFQQRDLTKLLRLPHGANYSVPGSGKTAVTYALYELERIAGRVDQLIVVAPLSAYGAWREEAVIWMEPLPAIAEIRTDVDIGAEILLINYQRIPGHFETLAKHMTAGATHLVLDEGHRIKRGWAGEWGTHCLRLAYFAERRDILTGTPAPNHPRDLEALIDFCWPGQGRVGLPQGVFTRRPDVGVVANAGRRLAPLFTRTTKDELELPSPRLSVTETPLGDLQAEIYDALRHRFAGRYRLTRFEEVNLAAMGRIVMYLLEAASNPALLSAGSSDDDPLSFRHPPLEISENAQLVDLIGAYGRYETPPKFVEVAKQVDRNRQLGKKTLVWSNFVRNLEWLRHRVLSELQPAMVHGGVPMERGTGPSRQEEIDRFRTDGDCWVLLANPAALAEGVSLHRECNSAIYIDRTFNAGQFLQSQDRIHRLGLADDAETTLTILMTPGTVDEIVNMRVAEKVIDLATLMHDPGLPEMSLPDEDDFGPPLDSHRDLEELFRHLRGG